MNLFLVFILLVIGALGQEECAPYDKLNDFALKALQAQYPEFPVDTRLTEIARLHAKDLYTIPRFVLCPYHIQSWGMHPQTNESCCPNTNDCMALSQQYTGISAHMTIMGQHSVGHLNEYGILKFIQNVVNGGRHVRENAMGIGVYGGAISFYGTNMDGVEQCAAPSNPVEETDYCNSPDPLVQAAVHTLKERFVDKTINSNLMKISQMHAIDSVYKGSSGLPEGLSWYQHPINNRACLHGVLETNCLNVSMAYLDYHDLALGEVVGRGEFDKVDNIINYVNNVSLNGTHGKHIGIGVFHDFISIHTADVQGELHMCEGDTTTTSTTIITTEDVSSSTGTTSSTTIDTTPTGTTSPTFPISTSSVDTTPSTSSSTTTIITTEDGSTTTVSSTDTTSSTTEGASIPIETSTTNNASGPTETTVSSAYSVAHPTTAIVMALFCSLYI